MKPFENPAVAQVFETYPPSARRKLMALRDLIFQTAASTEGVGEIEETLKWGVPAYVTSKTRSGSTVRIDWKKSNPTQYAMYFHCQTNLVETFRTLFPYTTLFRSRWVASTACSTSWRATQASPPSPVWCRTSARREIEIGRAHV